MDKKHESRGLGAPVPENVVGAQPKSKGHKAEDTALSSFPWFWEFPSMDIILLCR